ncbi:TetR/AcrR family transcriptional regulator [Paracoccus sp. (in: a-proteobacteria)]|uniref:TetR/AcrR family transcriptional regulator n=1 Tax=Paracoccus sp. TaxID=267 RepID=UPI00396C6B8E
MSMQRKSGLPYGLHERVIKATLAWLERSHTQAPEPEEVAEILGEPRDAVQRLFPDSTSLLVAAAEQALVILIDNCARAVVLVDAKDPVAQFSALADAYLAWADSYSAQFRLLTDSRLLHSLDHPSLNRYLNSMDALMVQMLTRAQKNGQLHPKENIPLLVTSARCFAYGLACMLVDGRMKDLSGCEGDPVETARMLSRDFIQRIRRSSRIT